MHDAYGSADVCAKVGVFRAGYRSEILPKLMYVRSVTRVFHTCGKNCGKSPRNAESMAQFGSESCKTVDFWISENSTNLCNFERK